MKSARGARSLEHGDPTPDPLSVGLEERALSDELAQRLATPEGLRTTRLLRRAGLTWGGTPSPDPLRSRSPEPIAIWEPQEVDGELVFVRPDPSPWGDHHAAVKTLRPKKSELPLRVCLFGESVAAGYLYAPRLTPAQVLESQLQTAGGFERFEVIDLARTNETLASLANTVRTALQINPDVLVLFTGNNWNLLETPEVSPYAPSVEAQQRYALALREGGVKGVVDLAEERLRRTAEEALDFVALIAQAVHIPVVVVLPEVNLVDWETRQPPVWLPGDSTARWHAFYKEAGQRLETEDWNGAVASAREMLELDGGACPSTWRLLARAWRGLGDVEEERRASVAEVDAARYSTLAFLGAPQTTTTARETLRAAARRHGFIPVDLQELFAEHTGSTLPDRRLFLDYCHLTAEGIQVAMAAVAAEVLNLSGMFEGKAEKKLDRRSLGAPVVTPVVEATARLGAAIHSAHRLLPVGPKAPILEHWCEAALEASPGVEEAMRDLLAARCAPGPAVLTAAQQRNLASPYRLTLQHGWRWDFLDADLIEALCAVLERRGRPVREEVSRALVENLGIGPKGTDLTQPPYLWEPLERFYPEVMSFDDLPRRATLRSPWPETGFCLICGGTRDVEIELTARVQALNGPSLVSLSVNGEDVGTAGTGERWTRTVLKVDRACMRPGLNRLTLHWPPLPPRGEEALQRATERLELGIAADLHPVFGEVFSLIARPGS